MCCNAGKMWPAAGTHEAKSFCFLSRFPSAQLYKGAWVLFVSSSSQPPSSITSASRSSFQLPFLQLNPSLKQHLLPSMSAHLALCVSSLLLPSPSFLTASLGSPYTFIFPRWINVGNCYGENSTVNYEFSRSFRCSVQLVSLMQSALALPLHYKSSSLNTKAGFIS